MNIVIVGPGNDPKRFGTNFVNKAENAGHSITKFSYRLDNDDPDTIENNFKLAIENLDHIDILLYNSIGGFYPGDFNHYHSGHSVKYKEWQQGILVNAAIPHMMTLYYFAIIFRTRIYYRLIKFRHNLFCHNFIFIWDVRGQSADRNTFIIIC